MALSKGPKAFNLSELVKGYFPHLFNKCEHQQIIIDCLPDINYYNPGGMMPEDRKRFMSWYDDHKNETSHFDKEIIKYRQSDVDFLRKRCLKFRHIFMQMTSRKVRKLSIHLLTALRLLLSATWCFGNCSWRKNLSLSYRHKDTGDRQTVRQSHVVEKYHALRSSMQTM